jgi:hypothetical protein
MYAILVSSIRATCPAHIIHDFIISTLFSDVLNLRFSFRFRDQVLYPYKITGKMRFEFFREAKMWIVVFWIVVTGIHAGGCQRF